MTTTSSDIFKFRSTGKNLKNWIYTCKPISIIVQFVQKISKRMIRTKLPIFKTWPNLFNSLLSLEMIEEKWSKKWKLLVYHQTSATKCVQSGIYSNYSVQNLATPISVCKPVSKNECQNHKAVITATQRVLAQESRSLLMMTTK